MPADQRRSRFEALAGLVGEPLHRYAARRTDPETARDVVADTLLVAWRRLEDVPEGGELPWCYAVARNCLANADRAARRRRGLLARIVLLDRPAETAPADPDLPDPKLHRALAALRDDDRELLRLWAWEDLTPAEIARVLHISPSAVHVRLHRARRRLAARILATGGSGGGKDVRGPGQEPVDDRRIR